MSGTEPVTFWNFLGVLHLTLEHRNLFQGESIAVKNIAENGWINVHESFMISRMSDMKQSGTFFGMLLLTPWSRIDISIFLIRVC